MPILSIMIRRQQIQGAPPVSTTPFANLPPVAVANNRNYIRQLTPESEFEEKNLSILTLLLTGIQTK